jgi:hypothetical protein
MIRPVLAHPETQNMKMTRAIRTMEPNEDTRPMTTPVKADEGEEDNPMMGFRRRKRGLSFSRLVFWFLKGRGIACVCFESYRIRRDNRSAGRIRENNQVTTLGGRRHRREWCIQESIARRGRESLVATRTQEEKGGSAEKESKMMVEAENKVRKGEKGREGGEMTRGDGRGWLVVGWWDLDVEEKQKQPGRGGGGGGSGLGPRDVATPHR